MKVTESSTTNEHATGQRDLSRLGSTVALFLCLIFLIGALAWEGEGFVRILALILGPGAVFFAWQAVQGRSHGGSLADRLKQVNASQIDLRLRETGKPDDENQQLFNELNQRLRAVIAELQINSLRTALASANSRLLSEQAARDATQQQQLSELIFHASEQTTAALQDVSSRASGVSSMNTRNLELASQSKIQMADARQKMQLISSAMTGFQENINALNATSGKVRDILSTVQDFSAQTNMLALNAAIEAARAANRAVVLR